MRHAAVVVTLTDSQPPQSEEGSAEKQSESSPGRRTHVDWCDAQASFLIKKTGLKIGHFEIHSSSFKLH